MSARKILEGGEGCQYLDFLLFCFQVAELLSERFLESVVVFPAREVGDEILTNLCRLLRSGMPALDLHLDVEAAVEDAAALVQDSHRPGGGRSETPAVNPSTTACVPRLRLLPRMRPFGTACSHFRAGCLSAFFLRQLMRSVCSTHSGCGLGFELKSGRCRLPSKLTPPRNLVVTVRLYLSTAKGSRASARAWVALRRTIPPRQQICAASLPHGRDYSNCGRIMILE